MQLQLPDPCPAEQLKQGSIFSVDGLQFQDDECFYTLRHFYPEIDFDRVRYGIVFSQTCDLVARKELGFQPKVTHITVGFLEPFNRCMRLDGESWLKAATMSWNLNVPDGRVLEYTLVCPQRLRENLKQKYTGIVQNNDQRHLFLEFEEEEDPERRYLLVNLAKSVPIRATHYKGLLDRVVYELKYEFAAKLGWKLAALYGRVDTTDYEEDRLERILPSFYDLMGDVMVKAVPRAIKIDDSTFTRARKLRDDKRKSAPEERQEFILGLLEALGSPADAPTASEVSDGSTIEDSPTPDIHSGSIDDELSKREPDDKRESDEIKA